MDYLEKLRQAQTQNNSWLCLGLDPQPDKLPPSVTWKHDEPVLPFNKAIIDQTADLVCAYKPNLGFYLQWGAAGIIALERTIAYIPEHIPIILDAKIGDIGNTQAAWGRGLFDTWEVDAITVNPYVGADAVVPLLTGRPDKAVYVLARTSNKAAAQFQGELADPGSLGRQVLTAGAEWSEMDDAGHCGFVVGATVPNEMLLARELAPSANFLIPGIGAQGGDLEAAVRHGPDAVAGPVINVSRSVLYASSAEDYAAVAREAADSLRQEINALREIQ